MTREEAYKEVTKLRPMYHDEVIEILDEVYDDIDSRICENCKHWSQEYINLGICLKEVDTERIDDLSDWCTVGDFGCNKF